MITAIDARKITIENSANKNLLMDVYDVIRESAEDGKYEAYIYEYIPFSVIDKLNELGYDVSEIDGKEVYCISWNLNR